MQTDRIRALHEMLERNPEDARARFGLATEYERSRRWAEAVRELQAYLALARDEGNAWGRLGHALRELGRSEEAREAYLKGAEAARAHGHPTMAAEFEEVLADWED